MLEWFDNLDKVFFFLINVTLSNPVTDAVMPVVTSDNLLRILYAVAMVLLLRKGDAKVRWLVLFSAITLTLTDQVSSKYLKPFFDRPRPCHVLENINLLVGCGGGKSMPSSHAANAFGQAMMFAYLFRSVRWYLMAFAAIVAISRVFVGVHYPGDVLVGSLIGMFIGLLVALTSRRFTDWWASRQQEKKEDTDVAEA